MSTAEISASTPVGFVAFLQQTDLLNETLLYELLNKSDEEAKGCLLTEEIKTEAEVQTFWRLWQDFQKSGLDEYDSAVIKRVPEQLARRYQAIAIKEEAGQLQVAMSNPLNMEAINQISHAVQCAVMPVLARSAELRIFINHTYKRTEQIVRYAREVNISALEQAGQMQDKYEVVSETAESTISRLVDSILIDAIYQQATDIHIEASSFHLRIRFRISGSMYEQTKLPQGIAEIILRRLLIMSGGDITELQLPQDTGFVFRYQKDLRNVRMSVLYTESGYSIVLRLLMPTEFYSDLKRFIEPETLSTIYGFLERRNGMMLVTGPTSSGKSTTLYSSLMFVNDENTKIITMEDPVESKLPGINQVEVNPSIGLDFGDVIRSTLRQNPDVLMLGEIRDSTSALMSMRAAMTGIMVLSTLHTKNTPGTVLRLVDLGVDPALISVGLRLVVAQRLLRLLCPYCKTENTITVQNMAVFSELGLSVEPSLTIFEAQGCNKCQQSGYYGVRAVFEVLVMDGVLVKLLAKKDVANFLEAAAEQIENKTLIFQAFELVKQGLASVEEVVKLSLD